MPTDPRYCPHLSRRSPLPMIQLCSACGAWRYVTPGRSDCFPGEPPRYGEWVEPGI